MPRRAQPWNLEVRRWLPTHCHRGGLWVALGAPWEFQVASQLHSKSGYGAIVGFCWLSVFSLLLSLPASKWLFILFWNLSRSTLSSQADPPILRDLDFSEDNHIIWGNQCFRSDDGLENVLGLSRAYFCCYRGRLGNPLGGLGGVLGTSWRLPNYFKNDSGIVFGFFLPPSSSYSSSCCFEVVLYLLLESLRADVELPS